MNEKSPNIKLHGKPWYHTNRAPCSIILVIKTNFRALNCVRTDHHSDVLRRKNSKTELPEDGISGCRNA